MQLYRLLPAVILWPVVAAGQEAPPFAEGASIYQAHCAACHDDVALRAPSAILLGTMSQSALMAALTTGPMATQGAALSPGQKRALIEALRGDPWTDPAPEAPSCSASPRELTPLYQSGWGGGPQALGHVPASGLSVSSVGRLELEWAFGFPGATRARSRPAVAGSVLIVGSQLGTVYGLDRFTGCTLWIVRATSSVRGAISVGRTRDGTMVAVFADFTGRVYAIEAGSGHVRWEGRARLDPHSSVTGSVTVADGTVLVPISSTEVVSVADPRLHCCGSTGGVAALDLETGHTLWTYRTIGEAERGRGASGAPVWSSPTVDLDSRTVFVGTGQNYSRPTTGTSDAIVALDLDTGVPRWVYQATRDDAFNLSCVTTGENCPSPPNLDVDFGMAPLVVDLGGARRVLLAGQKSGIVHALDARLGRLLWHTRVGLGGPNGGVHWGMAVAGETLFVPVSDRLSGIEGIDPVGHPRPGLSALSVETGRVRWSSAAPPPPCLGAPGCERGFSAAPTATNDLVFVGGLDGWLRAYETTMGREVWNFDTRRRFAPVNGIAATGGAIDGPGPVIVGDMLYLNSGYGLNGQMPGNVLLAFRVSGGGGDAGEG